MQFAQRWVRTVGGTGTVLGSDPVPSGFLEGRDNIVSIRNRPDRPLGRLLLAASYAGAGPAPTTLTADAYLYEAGSGGWYRLTAAPVALGIGVMVYVPIVGGLLSRVGDAQQNFKTYVRVIVAGGEAAGTYTFVADADQRVVA